MNLPIESDVRWNLGAVKLALRLSLLFFPSLAFAPKLPCRPNFSIGIRRVDQHVRWSTSSASDTTEAAAAAKEELLDIASKSNRGFQASKSDRQRITELVSRLSTLNPTLEPASPYYTAGESGSASDAPSLAGKWTLVYTDAPDITGLDTSQNPFSTVELGRIGQECDPPFIKNVIEWKRPSWAKDLPFSGSSTTEPRILQKVVTKGEADPSAPLKVNLKVAGLQLESPNNTAPSEGGIGDQIEKLGLPAALLSANPIDLSGPWNPPFGQFQILYLDDSFRVIRTYQNYLAVNQRIRAGEEWF